MAPLYSGAHLAFSFTFACTRPTRSMRPLDTRLPLSTRRIPAVATSVSSAVTLSAPHTWTRRRLSATAAGSFLFTNKPLLNKVSGVAIIALGVLFISSVFVVRLNREFRPHALIERAGKGGPVVAGANLDAAVNAIEELEETARLYLLLRGAKTRFLTPAQVKELLL